MIIIKFFILIILFLISCYIGVIISKKYSNRVKELKQIKNSLNMLENKIKFTYEPIPEIFKQIGENFIGNISQMYKTASERMNNTNAGNAWQQSIQTTSCNLLQEDKDILFELGKLLGKTDVEGQISQLNLINQFIDTQIKTAEVECNKSEKLYKKLGVISGIMIIITLI